MKHPKRFSLLLLLAVPLLMAPAVDIPEKLTAGAANWNREAQAFEIPLAVHRRFVSQDGYFVGLCVSIVDPAGLPVAELYHAEPIIPQRDHRLHEDG